MTLDLLVLQEPLLEYVQLKLFACDKVVGVAVNFTQVDGAGGVCGVRKGKNGGAAREFVSCVTYVK